MLVLRKILQAERERKNYQVFEKPKTEQKIEHNKKLRDCRTSYWYKTRNLENAFYYWGRFCIRFDYEISWCTQAVLVCVVSLWIPTAWKENCLWKWGIQFIAGRIRYEDDDMENLYNNSDRNGCRCRWNAHSFIVTFFLQFFLNW
jgi:hypothetical protein